MSNEQELVRIRAERDALRDFIDNAPDMFVSVDRNARVIDCNATALQFLGMSRDEVIGRHMMSFYHEDCIEECLRVIESSRVTGNASSDNLMLRKNDGSTVPVSLRVSSVRDEDGQILYSRSVWRDMSVAHENALLKLEAKLQESQRMESQALLAGGIAHDFNNLLVGVLGNAGIALMQVDEQSELHPLLKDIECAALRAAELTRQMLAYSGKGRFQVTAVDLSGLVGEMSHLMEAAVTSSTTLDMQLSEQPFTIKGDPTQLRQVVMNLITNGAAAIAGSGTVTIRSGHTTISAADVGKLVDGNNLEPGEYGFLEVSDNGCGMSDKVATKMFEPFFTTKTDGHGLGLAAMLGIVHGHGGGICVDTKLTVGTTIRVLLPLSEAKQPTESDPKSKVEHHGGRVLIIDDQQHVRSMATRTLASHGYEILVACDGCEGVEIFKQNSDDIDLVLLDLTMPKMNGHQALSLIRAVQRDSRVVMMSGYSKTETLANTEEGGPSDFLAKPFTTDQLLDTVARNIRPARTPGAARLVTRRATRSAEPADGARDAAIVDQEPTTICSAGETNMPAGFAPGT